MKMRWLVGILLLALIGFEITVYNACSKKGLEASSAGNPSGGGGGKGTIPKNSFNRTPENSNAISVINFSTQPALTVLPSHSGNLNALHLIGELTPEFIANRKLEFSIKLATTLISADFSNALAQVTTDTAGKFELSLPISKQMYSGATYVLVGKIVDTQPIRTVLVRPFRFGDSFLSNPKSSVGSLEDTCVLVRSGYSNYSNGSFTSVNYRFDSVSVEFNELARYSEVNWTDRAGSEIAMHPFNYAKRETAEKFQARWPACQLTKFPDDSGALSCQESVSGPLLQGTSCEPQIGLDCNGVYVNSGQQSLDFESYPEYQVEWSMRSLIAAVTGVLAPIDITAMCMWHDGLSVLGMTVSGF